MGLCSKKRDEEEGVHTTISKGDADVEKNEEGDEEKKEPPKLVRIPSLFAGDNCFTLACRMCTSSGTVAELVSARYCLS